MEKMCIFPISSIVGGGLLDYQAGWVRLPPIPKLALREMPVSRGVLLSRTHPYLD